MSKRLRGLALGVVGMGLVVACSSSSGTPAVVTDAGHTPDSGMAKDAGKPVKDSGAVKDTGVKHDSATPKPDAASGGDAGSTICGSMLSTGTASCDTCLSGLPACCTAITACDNDMTCSGCLAGGSGAGCTTNTLLTAVNTSCNTTTGTCATACAPPNTCNPVTNAECVAQQGAGATCDSGQTGYACFMGPGNTIAVCGACDPTFSGMTFCGPGTTCFTTDGTTGKCAQYCCTDADCGTGGVCDLTLLSSGFGGGLCTGTATTDAGTTDAGATDAAPKDAAISDAAAGPTLQCTGIPATPPSNGSCITFNPDAGMTATGDGG